MEALLHDTFGGRSVCSTDLRDVWAKSFAARDCQPLAEWAPYYSTFANAHGSAFHLSQRRPTAYFTGRPMPVFVGRRFIACDRAERTFLVAAGELACRSPAGRALATVPGPRRSPHLTRGGLIVWHYEALMHDTSSVAAGERSLFANARHSAFHLTWPRPSLRFGNAEPVLIQNRWVVCDKRERTFLIRGRFDLICAAPL